MSNRFNGIYLSSRSPWVIHPPRRHCSRRRSTDGLRRHTGDHGGCSLSSVLLKPHGRGIRELAGTYTRIGDRDRGDSLPELPNVRQDCGLSQGLLLVRRCLARPSWPIERREEEEEEEKQKRNREQSEEKEHAKASVRCGAKGERFFLQGLEAKGDRPTSTLLPAA